MKFRIAKAAALAAALIPVLHGFEGHEGPWRRLVSGDVALYCRPDDLKNGERVVEVIQRTSPRILADLDMAEPESLTVFLAATKEEFRALTQGLVPDWSSGAADPARSVLFLQSRRFGDPDDWADRAVVHELAHAVLGMALGGKPAERWFEEGFAMLEAGEGGFGGTARLWWAFVFGTAIPLGEIDNVLEFNREQAALAYKESLSAVKYLVERYGIGVLPAITAALRAGHSMDKALFSAAGVGMAAFESEWSRAVKRKSGFVLLLDASFFAGIVFVILFFSALLATRIRTGKIRKTWDKDENQNGAIG